MQVHGCPDDQMDFHAARRFANVNGWNIEELLLGRIFYQDFGLALSIKQLHCSTHPPS
jgi:hypothetical protein